MFVEIIEESRAKLAEYAAIPIVFEVRDILDIPALASGASSSLCNSRPLSRPFLKDYDADRGNSPLEWDRHFDLTHWGFFAARERETRIGGAVVVFPADGLDVDASHALLWDLRVAPNARRRGVGSALLLRAEAWSQRRGAPGLMVETQDINVPAYRFYTSHGFELVKVRRGVYPEHPDEVQLWLEKRLSQAV